MNINCFVRKIGCTTHKISENKARGVLPKTTRHHCTAWVSLPEPEGYIRFSNCCFPDSIVQWTLVMPLCKCSLCWLSFYLLNSPKAVQNRFLFCQLHPHSCFQIFHQYFQTVMGGKKTPQEIGMIAWISNML